MNKLVLLHHVFATAITGHVISSPIFGPRYSKTGYDGMDGHVLRKDDNDWVKKCMEYEVVGSRLRGRPKRTWLEAVQRLPSTWIEQG